MPALKPVPYSTCIPQLPDEFEQAPRAYRYHASRAILGNRTVEAASMAVESCLSQQVRAAGIKKVVAAPRSSWQTPHGERVIGSIRPEYMDRIIIFDEHVNIHNVAVSPSLEIRASQPRTASGFSKCPSTPEAMRPTENASPSNSPMISKTDSSVTSSPMNIG